MYKRPMRYVIVASAVLALLIALTSVIHISCKKSEQPARTESSTEPGKPETIVPSETSDQIGPSEKIALRILYAGLQNTDRAKDFVEFLAAHFQRVETTDYITFTGNDTGDFDVVIIDYDGLNTRAAQPKVSRSYARATVTVGVPGALLCRRLSLKTGYL